jgi:uncharacterized protein with FMN-binding domain
MRKTLIIIITVAILGALGLYAKNHDNSSAPVAGSTSASSSSSTPAKNYKDGTYAGSSAETPYGTVQIAAVISGGKITDINFLKMPDGEDRSRQITSGSEAQLKENALQAQSSNIDFVSGATSTSYGYKESLQAALDKAASSAYESQTVTMS